MPSSFSWSRKAYLSVSEAIKEGKAKGLDGKALEGHVRAAYPFGERAHHPYKVWLAWVNRLLLGKYASPRTRSRRTRIAKLAKEWPGMTEEQRRFFES